MINHIQDLLKILVCHHKEDQLLDIYANNPEIYVHYHGGRAQYDGSNKFLLDMLGDDDPKDGNLSKYNSKINEYTVLYSAWKTNDVIKGSEYIGLNHYRRAFTIEDILKFFESKKDIACYKNILSPNTNKILESTLFEQYVKCHGEKYINKFFDLTDKDISQKFHSSKMFFPKAMFIMKKDIFESFMKTIDRYIQEMLKNEIFFDGRNIAFIYERLVSIFIEDHIERCFLLDIPIEYI